MISGDIFIYFIYFDDIDVDAKTQYKKVFCENPKNYNQIAIKFTSHVPLIALI